MGQGWTPVDAHSLKPRPTSTPLDQCAGPSRPQGCGYIWFQLKVGEDYVATARVPYSQLSISFTFDGSGLRIFGNSSNATFASLQLDEASPSQRLVFSPKSDNVYHQGDLEARQHNATLSFSDLPQALLYINSIQFLTGGNKQDPAVPSQSEASNQSSSSIAVTSTVQGSSTSQASSTADPQDTSTLTNSPTVNPSPTTDTPTPPPESAIVPGGPATFTDSHRSRNNAPLIAGAVCGVLAAGIIVAVAYFWILKRRSRSAATALASADIIGAHTDSTLKDGHAISVKTSNAYVFTRNGANALSSPVRSPNRYISPYTYQHPVPYPSSEDTESHMDGDDRRRSVLLVSATDRSPIHSPNQLSSPRRLKVYNPDPSCAPSESTADGRRL
ncbi:hypothetical protein BKA62DRAFT_689493 [Auriculariales sp. MPI-PUGE-AT-0066]|nr:hypothetical protein BKA62DRAFT_689493 [Auriculariales sp. MPI-PUGE-AT-0066]